MLAALASAGLLLVAFRRLHGAIQPLTGGQIGGHRNLGKIRDKPILSRV